MTQLPPPWSSFLWRWERVGTATAGPAARVMTAQVEGGQLFGGVSKEA